MVVLYLNPGLNLRRSECAGIEGCVGSNAIPGNVMSRDLSGLFELVGVLACLLVPWEVACSD
jgi:hypothetical protein